MSTYVNILLNTCRQNITPLSLLVGTTVHINIDLYLHFQSKPIINLSIFASINLFYIKIFIVNLLDVHDGLSLLFALIQ